MHGESTLQHARRIVRQETKNFPLNRIKRKNFRFGCVFLKNFQKIFQGQVSESLCAALCTIFFGKQDIAAGLENPRGIP